MIKVYNMNVNAEQQIKLVPFAEFIGALKQGITEGLDIPIEYMFSDWLQLDAQAVEDKINSASAVATASDKAQFQLDNSYTIELLTSLGVSFEAIKEQQIIKYFAEKRGKHYAWKY